MAKRVFQIIDEMNFNDEIYGTATAGICNQMLRADKVKAGGHVTMGVPEEVLTDIMLNKKTPLLLILDMKAYEKIKSEPESYELLTACIEMYKHITETYFDVCGNSAEELSRWDMIISKQKVQVSDTTMLP